MEAPLQKALDHTHILRSSLDTTSVKDSMSGSISAKILGKHTAELLSDSGYGFKLRSWHRDAKC